MVILIGVSFKYIRKFSSFKDFYTLWTLITLIISLMWDFVAIPGAYPWYSIEGGDMLEFISIQLS